MLVRFTSPTELFSHQLNFFLANWFLVSPTALFSRQLNFGLTNCTFFSPTELCSHQLHFFLAKWFCCHQVIFRHQHSRQHGCTRFGMLRVEILTIFVAVISIVNKNITPNVSIFFYFSTSIIIPSHIRYIIYIFIAVQRQFFSYFTYTRDKWTSFWPWFKNICP